MLNKFSLNHILIALAVVFLTAGLYIYFLPSQNVAFEKSEASQDTTSFNSYVRGTVTEVVFEQVDAALNNQTITQQLKVELKKQAEGQTENVIEIDNTQILDKAGSVKYKVGDRVVIGVLPDSIQDKYVIVDRDRSFGLYIIVALFLVLAIGVGLRKGLTSLLGLAISGAILIFFIAPQILQGKDAFVVSLVGAGAIVMVSMFISHGFTRRIKIAAISTIVALAISAVLTWGFVSLANLFGLGQSDAFLLQTGFLGTLNLKGVLLAGIIISVLGILDDVTTAQTAAVEELKKADPNLGWKELYSRGLSIGREHIASLINTLILVYAGAALPLFLLLTLQNGQPLWVLFNSEFIAEELVRALVGSMALILAVPVSTFLAAIIFRKMKNMI